MVKSNIEEIQIFFDKIFEFDKEVTDIFINEKKGIRFRSKNSIKKIKVDLKYTRNLFTSFFYTLTAIEKENYRKNKSIDTSLQINNKRFRIIFYNEYSGNAIAIRILENKPKYIKDIGVDMNIINNLISNNSGLVLISGPTSSGKTTSMSSIIEHIGNTKPYHILTIEDPVEYMYSGEKAFISQREIGSEVDNYEKAIKDSLRSNPNIIVVGEIRDKNTAIEVMKARQTGHLVFSTIHADNVINTIERFIGLFPKEEKKYRKINLSNCLKGILNQRLIKYNDNSLNLLYEHIFGTIDVLGKIKEESDKIIELRTIMETNKIQNIDDKLLKLYRLGRISKDILIENRSPFLKNKDF